MDCVAVLKTLAQNKYMTALQFGAAAILSCSALASAQSSAHAYKNTSPYRPSKAVARTTASQQPRSVPGSAVLPALGVSTAASRGELIRLEQMGSPQPGNTAQHHASRRVPTRPSAVAKAREQNPPINFSYQAPKTKTK